MSLPDCCLLTTYYIKGTVATDSLIIQERGDFQHTGTFLQRQCQNYKIHCLGCHIILIDRLFYSGFVTCWIIVVLQLFSRVWLFATLWTAHTRVPCPSPTPGACLNSCPLSQWCHPTISSLVIPFSSCLQSFPATGFFLVNQFFTSGGQSIGASAST